jgi:NCS2 family nucleobase:cation symporter-2
VNVAAHSTRAPRPEDERLPLGKTLTYGMQHVLTMYGGIIAPPLIVGGAAGLSSQEIGALIASCLFVGGLATILQTVGIPFFGSQLPLVQGTSFAAVATMVAIIDGGGGIQRVFGAVLVASFIGFLIAPGFARIIRFFPPVVTGVVITMIGIALLPVAANWAMGGNASAENYGAPSQIGLAMATLCIALLLTKFGSVTIQRLAILISMVLGAILATVLGMTDFSRVGQGEWFALPQPLAFGWPEFEIGSIISMTVVVLVILTETTADIIALGQIVGTPVNKRRIADGLRADMAASMLAPFLNTFTQSAFAQNVGLTAITGVKSRFVVTAGGGILVVLGLFPVLGQVVAALPTPVLGGAGIVLFGTIAASGIRTLSQVIYEGNYNLIIVSTSIAVGCLPVVKPNFYDAFPSWFATIFDSGISSAAFTAVVLNLFFNELKFARKRRRTEALEVAAPAN